MGVFLTKLILYKYLYMCLSLNVYPSNIPTTCGFRVLSGGESLRSDPRGSNARVVGPPERVGVHQNHQASFVVSFSPISSGDRWYSTPPAPTSTMIETEVGQEPQTM